MTVSLSDLKPGDTVILRHSTPYNLDRIATVDRLTKTQIIVGSRRFRISDGKEIGCSHWDYYRIVPATPDQIAEVERRQQINQDQERAYQLAVQVGNRAAAAPLLLLQSRTLKRRWLCWIRMNPATPNPCAT
jgi:hypothetical protein